MVIGSTKGLRTSTETFARRPVFFTANAFFYPANTADSGRSGADSTGASDDSPRLTTRKRQKAWKVTAIQKEKTS
jgi:hypothetical protein